MNRGCAPVPLGVSVDDARLRNAKHVWLALQRTARASKLHGAENPRIRRATVELCQRMHEAVTTDGSLELTLEPGGVASGGRPVAATEDRVDDLAGLLYREGLRGLRIGQAWAPDVTTRLLHLLVTAMDPPPGARPLAEVLPWETVPGTTFRFDSESVPLRATTDPGSFELPIARLLEQGGDAQRPLAVDAVRAVWDARGGVIQWPLPRRAGPLEPELRDAAGGVPPAERFGIWLSRTVESRQSPGEALALLAHLPQQIDGLLAAGQPGHAARLIAPLLRGAEQGSAAEESVRLQIAGVLPQLLSEERLAALLAGATDGTLDPAGLGAYLAALPSSALGVVLGIVARLPPGPARAAAERAALVAAARDPAGAQEALTHADEAALDLALQILESAADFEAGPGLGLAILARSKGPLLQRAVRLLACYPSRPVAERFVRLLQDRDEVVRRTALGYVAHHRFPPAYPALQDLAAAAWITQLPFDQQVEIIAALGAVGRDEALGEVRRHLRGFETGTAERVLPWLRCLVAIETRAAHRELRDLVAKAPPHLHAYTRQALTDLERALQEPGDQPALQTAPGAAGPPPPSLLGNAWDDGDGW